jgi:hypothetical protein
MCPASMADRLQALAFAVLAVALGVGAVRALQAGWMPVGDEALIEMKVRDVPAHLPLLGVYSRFGWSHPGPAQFLALAVPYRLLGSASAALLAGALAGHLLALAAAWWTTRRIDRLAGVVVLVALELVLLGTPADLARSAWNPYVALLLAGLMVLVAWGASERQPFATVLLLPLGSLLVQAHVGNVPLVVLTVLAAAPLAWWTHRSSPDDTPEGDRPVPWRAAAWGLGLAVLMWVPAVVEQLRSDDGNLARILSDLGRDEPRIGLGAAAGLSSRFFGPLPAWIDQRSLVLQIAETGWVVPVWLLVPLAAFVVAWRRGDRTYERGLVIGAAGVVSTAVAAASIKGVFFSYLTVGHRSIVAVVMAMSIAALARTLTPSRRVQVEVAMGAAAVVAAVAIGVFQWSARNPSQPFDATVRAVTAAVEQQAGGDPVFITSTDDDPSRDVASGLLLQLERAGVPATTVRGEDWRMGAHRTSDGAGSLQVKVVPVGQEQVLADEGYRVLVEYQPLSPGEVAELDRLVAARDAAIAQGEQAGPDDPDAAARFATVQELAAQIDELRGDRISTVVGVRRSSDADADADADADG